MSADFRTEVREYLEANCPPSMRTVAKEEEDYYWGGRNSKFASEDQKTWFEAMAFKGWNVPTWPKEYGGGGLNKEETKILQQEMKRLKCRQPILSFGIWMLGPALLQFGSEEQKHKYIPDIINGKIRWCQGYSEPDAGSDLAGLQTSAVSDGDHYIVNGQKVWTSYADKSDCIFALVRTDNEGKKQQGISFLLIDMATKGVSTRPIKLISGSSPFCETFFDNVRVPKANIVGEENAGWTVAKYLLTHEREMVGASFSAQTNNPLNMDVRKYLTAKANGQFEDSVLRAQIAEWEINGAGFLFTMERMKDEAKAGQAIGAKSSFLKYYGTELNKDKYELMMTAGGLQALGWEGEAFDGGKLARDFCRTKGNSIEGGTSEIQLNIISKHLLGLPTK